MLDTSQLMMLPLSNTSHLRTPEAREAVKSLVRACAKYQISEGNIYVNKNIGHWAESAESTQTNGKGWSM